MSQVNDSTNYDSAEYYDSYDNQVSEDGYILDETGNYLVTTEDTELTVTYTVVGNDGVTYTLGSDAVLSGGAILSSAYEYICYDENGNTVSTEGYVLDENGDPVTTEDTELTEGTGYVLDGTTYSVTASGTDGYYYAVSSVATTASVYTDANGHEVDENGYLLDDEGNVLEVSADDLTQSTTEGGYSYTDSSGNAYTVTASGSDGYYYAVSSVDSTVYADANGSTVTADGYLADDEGNALEIAEADLTENAASDEDSWTYTYNGYTYEVDVDNDETSADSGMYYIASSVASTAYTDSSGNTTDEDGYLLDDEGSQRTVTASAVTAAYAYTSSDGDSYTLVAGEDDDSVYWAEYTGDVTTTYYDSNGDVTEDTDSIDSVEYTTANGALLYATYDDEGAVSAYYYSTDDGSSAATVDTADSSVSSTVSYAEDGVTYSTADGTLVASGSDYLLKASSVVTHYYDANGQEVDSEGYLYDSDSGSRLMVLESGLTYTAAGESSYSYTDSSGNVYTVTASGTDGYYHAVSSVATTSYADANGNAVTAAGYLADDEGNALEIAEDDLTYSEGGDTVYVYTDDDGCTYEVTASENDGYYYVVSSVADSSLAYADSAGHAVDENGYLLDDDGSVLLVSASDLETVYSVTATDGTVYYVSSTATINSGYVITEVSTASYYDVYGNAVNAAGYLIDLATGYLITTSASELTAVYSFTDVNGIVYQVGADAVIQANGTVYSTIDSSATRYYLNGVEVYADGTAVSYYDDTEEESTDETAEATDSTDADESAA